MGYDLIIQPVPSMQNPVKHIGCVITCVNYSDFLSHCLLWNNRHFNEVIVVTKSTDWHTQRVCKFHHVRCIPTDSFGEKFNKAAGINIGLDALKKSDWIIHMDSDIVLPPRTREFINTVPLDPLSIYGVDRVMVPSAEAWHNFICEPVPQHEDNVFIHTSPFKIGTRVFKIEHQGWLPIGFFQMWNVASGITTYPEYHEDAARSDMLMALQWPRERRHILPEILAYHLATEDNGAEMKGKNWQGRITNKFLIGEQQQ